LRPACRDCEFAEDVRGYVLRNLAREGVLNMVQGGNRNAKEPSVEGVS
jgi:hypothetical protein